MDFPGWRRLIVGKITGNTQQTLHVVALYLWQQCCVAVQAHRKFFLMSFHSPSSNALGVEKTEENKASWTFSSFHFRPLTMTNGLQRVVNLSATGQTSTHPPIHPPHPPTTSPAGRHSSLFRPAAARPMGCWRLTKSRGRCHDLRSAPVD